MATGTDPALASRELGIEDMNEVFEALVSVSEKYDLFGMKIGVKITEINQIKMQLNNNPKQCLLNILLTRLRQLPALTWSDIDKALTSESVNEGRLAQRIRSERERLRGKEREYSSSSGTDDDSSSPECDMLRNLTESENKGLIKAFKCSFGKLCLAIKDPDKAAAELQARRLLSCSKMESIFISPESQQVKTITLVRALTKRIKLRPVRVFAILKVFLHNEMLKEAGREILNETGKVCPDRTASVLGDKLPPSELMEKASNQNNGYDQAVSDINQPRTTGATEMVLSQKVTQSVPQTGLSPVLEKYKEYLRSCYNARALAPADKYLPTLEAPYINLAMIEREQSYNPDQRDEFTWHTLHGGIDQILQYKTCINIESLLTPEDSAKPVRFILVEGPPGIGKSTFAWEVCRRWDEIESLRHYHTVVLLKLREKWVLNALSLSDLLRYPSHPDFSASISDELVQSQGEKCLFVLDGFDEVSHRFHENSAIKSILCRQLLPKCTIILTTRPVAKVTLRSICQPRIYKHVEIIGFTEEERVRYITEVFSEKKELQEKFLKHMFLVPHIKSMMYIPLNCAIIAQVYYESQSSHHLAIPRTRTQLYKALTNSLLVRHMKKKEGNHEYTSTLPEGLNEEDMGNFKALAMFAFDSYHKGYSKKVTFFQEDIPKGLVHFGFMNESTEMYAEKAVERTFSFLHLSLQEYLAAWHLANICSIEFQVAYHRLAIGGCSILYKGDNEDEKALISSLKQHGSSLVEPAMFLAGITGWKYQSWKNYLNHDTAGVVESSAFLRPLYETQNPEMVSHYFSGKCTQYSDKMAGIPPISLKKKITIDSDLTPYDCYAISYCLAYSSDQDQFSFSLNITSNHISYVETFVKGLDDHCKSVTPRVNYLQIYTTIDDIENVDKCLSWILKVKFLAGVQNAYFDSKSMKSSLANQLIESLAELKSLKICVGSHTPWEWLVSLNFPSKLEILHIYGSKECRPLPNDLIFMLEGDALKNVIFDIQFPSNTIYELCSPIDSLINSVVESVLGSSQITQIVLPNISRKTMAGVHSILLQCPSLTSLELKGTRLGYDGIIFICSALRKNGRLKNLVIHDDLQLPPSRSKRTMGDIKFSCFSSVEKVDLPDKSTCTDFLLVLNNILEGNTTLEKISIKSGLFLPLSAGECRDFCQWTGLGPLQQFNVGAIARGTFPNLRRSFSLSNLTQPQAVLFWDKRFLTAVPNESADINFQELFSKRKEEGNKFSRPSFTAPDCEVLQSFSGLDPRLMKCLEISEQFLLPPTHPVNETSTYNHRKRLSETFNRMCAELTKKMNIE